MDQNFRLAFGIPDEITYLNCSYMSPLHKSVLEAGMAGLQLKQQPWHVAPDDFFSQSNEVRSAFAQMIGAKPCDIALIPSVSYGITTASINIPIGEGQKIVVLEEQFPSNIYPWQEIAKTKKAEIVTVSRSQDGNWTQAVLDQLNRDVAVLACPICHWTDGSMLHLEQISKACQDLGVALVIDATQSLGALPFDIAKTPCDFLVAAAYKWLLGPYSLAYMYVNPKYHHGRPIEFNWITRKDAENFAGLVNYKDEMMPDAQRFDVGERSNFILLPMAEMALKLIQQVGVAEIQSRLREKTRFLEKASAAFGFETGPEQHRAGHMIGLRSPHGLKPDLSQRLAASKIFVSIRGTSIRVSPHLYNTQTDLDRFIEALSKA